MHDVYMHMHKHTTHSLGTCHTHRHTHTHTHTHTAVVDWCDCFNDLIDLVGFVWLICLIATFSRNMHMHAVAFWLNCNLCNQQLWVWHNAKEKACSWTRWLLTEGKNGKRVGSSRGCCRWSFGWCGGGEEEKEQECWRMRCRSFGCCTLWICNIGQSSSMELASKVGLGQDEIHRGATISFQQLQWLPEDAV